MRSGLAIVAVVAAFAGTLFIGGRALGVWDGPLPGASAASADEEDSQAGGEPPGWTLHRVQREGFALAVPPGWQVRRSRDARAVLGRGLPAVPPTVRSFIKATLRHTRFVAVETAAKPFRANVNVVVFPSSRPEILSSENLKALRTMLPIRGRVEQRRLGLPGGEVLRLRFGQRLGRGAGVLKTTQYHFWRDGKAYTVTYTAAAEGAGKYDALFRQSAETFQFLKPPPEKKRPAVDPAEARWVREANALCRRAEREFKRFPMPESRDELAQAFETLASMNRGFNAELLALPAPPSFATELDKMRVAFAREERLFESFIRALRARDEGRVRALQARLDAGGRAQEAVLVKLGAEACIDD